MGHEFGAFKFVGHWWWSVFGVAPGTLDGNQRRNQFERVWYLQLQPGLQFRSIRWFRLSMVVQLLFLQQETQTHRIFYMQSNQVNARISTSTGLFVSASQGDSHNFSNWYERLTNPSIFHKRKQLHCVSWNLHGLVRQISPKFSMR